MTIAPAISRDCDDRICRRLFTIYGDKFDLDLADEMVEALRHASKPPTDEEYTEAVSRWIARSKWAPKPADILSLIEEVRAEQIQSHAAALDTFENQTADIEALAPESTTTKSVQVQVGTSGAVKTLTYTVDAYTARCKDCSDRGIAHFYADPKDANHVYLSSEWDEMTEAQQQTYRHHIAICDCARGLANPKREHHLVKWHNGRDREMSAYPLMEIVRKIARQRQQSEQAPLQLVESGRYGN